MDSVALMTSGQGVSKSAVVLRLPLMRFRCRSVDYTRYRITSERRRICVSSLHGLYVKRASSLHLCLRFAADAVRLGALCLLFLAAQ
ncbi:hypothetical protein INR49_017480 [Caranx melampygus]|nr:hypothetical protein INR49_017480 [Caranx melampygus]